jgi:uncharacterized protein (TIRG00374 family)
VLYLVLQRTDIRRLGDIVSQASLVMILGGIALFVLIVTTGALRWRVLLVKYGCAAISGRGTVLEYWKSLAAGVAAPGTLGVDAYRVMVLGRAAGNYLRNAFVVVVEKVAALVACGFLVSCMYPFLPTNRLPLAASSLVDVIHLVFVAGTVFLCFIVVVRRHRWAQRLRVSLAEWLDALSQRIASVVQRSGAPERPRRGRLHLMFSVFSPSVLLPAVFLSLLILLLAACQAQLFFHALGYDVPLRVNVFVTPLIFLLLTLPISFGGIGIREGAYVVLYGAFGAPVEAALLVSFCSWFSVLLAQAVGAVLLLSRVPPRSPKPSHS